MSYYSTLYIINVLPTSICSQTTLMIEEDSIDINETVGSLPYGTR